MAIGDLDNRSGFAAAHCGPRSYPAWKLLRFLSHFEDRQVGVSASRYALHPSTPPPAYHIRRACHAPRPRPAKCPITLNSHLDFPTRLILHPTNPRQHSYSTLDST